MNQTDGRPTIGHHPNEIRPKVGILVAHASERTCWEACEAVNGQGGSASGAIMSLYAAGLRPTDLTIPLVAAAMLLRGRLTAAQYREVIAQN